jgi:hypothetical protein
LSITLRRATDQHAPAIAHVLRELGLFSQVSSETPQSTQARVPSYLRFDDSDDCHSLYFAVGVT